MRWGLAESEAFVLVDGEGVDGRVERDHDGKMGVL